MATIRDDLSLDGVPLVRLESDLLRLDIAPSIGGRGVSLIYKPAGYQFLWRNQALNLERLEPFSEYDSNFYGGIDELLPNDIPEEVNGVASPDHGELWTTAFDYAIDGDALELRGAFPIIGLTYERRVTLRENESVIDLAYKITNTTSERKVFLWKLHAALHVAPGDTLICPAGKAVVPDLEWSRWHTLEPFDWPEIEGQRANVVPEPDGSVDFLHLYDLREGRMAWQSATNGLTFEYRFDTAVFPYAWYFASYGGFDGHVMAILEPCTTIPLSVGEAAALGQCSVLEPGATLETVVEIYAGPTQA